MRLRGLQATDEEHGGPPVEGRRAEGGGDVGRGATALSATNTRSGEKPWAMYWSAPRRL